MKRKLLNKWEEWQENKRDGSHNGLTCWGDVMKRDNMITVDHGMKDVPPPPSSSRPQLEKHDIRDEPIPGAAHLALLHRCDRAFRIPTMQSGSHETLAACSLDAHPIAHSPQLHSDKQVKKKKCRKDLLLPSALSGKQPSFILWAVLLT